MNSSTNYVPYPSCPLSNKNDITSLTMRYVVPTLFSITDLIGLVGNLLVIIVIIGCPRMQNNTNMLIVSLAFADLSFIIICVPLTAMVYVTNSWPLAEIFCKFYFFFTYFSVYCSVYTLVLMCLDRFLAVVFPIKSRSFRTKQNTAIVVIFIWIIITLANLPIFVSSKILIQVLEDETSVCQTSMCQNGWLFEYNQYNELTQFINYRSQIFFGLFFVFGYAFPLSLICIFYGFLLHRILYGTTSRMSKSESSVKSKKKATKLVIVVVLVFAFCWLPIQVIFMIQNFSGDNDSFAFRMAHIFGNILAYVNSSVNPILYAFCSKNFRCGFLALLCLDRLKLKRVREFDSNKCRLKGSEHLKCKSVENDSNN